MIYRNVVPLLVSYFITYRHRHCLELCSLYAFEASFEAFHQIFSSCAKLHLPLRYEWFIPFTKQLRYVRHLRKYLEPCTGE